MQQLLKGNKLIAGAVVVIVLGLLYYLYSSSGSGAAPLTTDTGPSQESQSLLVTLSNLHSIQLNNAIFSDPVFLSLSDFGVTIPLQNVGRRNPFLPYTGGTAQSPIKIPIPKN